MNIYDVRCDRCGTQLDFRETTDEDGYRLILVQPCSACCPAEDQEIEDDLVQAALGVLADEANARTWLTRPVRALGGAVPAELAKTPAGKQEVLDLIGRIEYGVFS